MSATDLQPASTRQATTPSCSAAVSLNVSLGCLALVFLVALLTGFFASPAAWIALPFLLTASSIPALLALFAMMHLVIGRDPLPVRARFAALTVAIAITAMTAAPSLMVAGFQLRMGGIDEHAWLALAADVRTGFASARSGDGRLLARQLAPRHPILTAGENWPRLSESDRGVGVCWGGTLGGLLCVSIVDDPAAAREAWRDAAVQLHPRVFASVLQ